jgi:two-component system NtrC family sensor kinase
MMKKTLLIGILLIVCYTCWAQKKRQDSLLTKIEHINDPEQLSIVQADLLATSGGDFALLKKAKRDLAVAEAAAVPEKEARALLMICFATFTMHDLPGLLDASLKGISISQNINNNFYLSRFLHMAALANTYAQDWQKSVSYSLQAAHVAMAAGDIVEAISNYSNLESDYAEVKKLDSALFYARLEFALLTHAKSPNKWDYERNALGDLGEALTAAGKPDSALKYYRLAYNIGKQHFKSFNLPYMENNMARVYLDIGKPDSAKKYALFSFSQASKNKIWEFTADAANILAQVYQGHDDKQNIYYLKAEMAAKDSINAADKSRQFQLIADRDRQRREDLKAEQDKFNTRIRFYAVIATAAVLLIIGILLWRNNRRQKLNNRLLSEQKEEIEAQRDNLEETLNKLKQTQTQLIQSEKMASLGELTAGIAHEIQNPLNFVNNFSEVNAELIEEMKEEIEKGDLEEIKALALDIEENSKKINLHGKRADGIVKGMLQHSQSGSGARELTNINALADEYMRLAYHGLRAKDKAFNAEMATHFDPVLPKIMVIGQDIGRVMLNLFNNAFYAVSKKQKTAGTGYKPEVTVTTYAENGQVVLKVKDNGTGIPDSIKEKIMQPFFTTKPTGEGTGLGLSLTYDMVVKGHGGSIQVNSVEGEGSEFAISLPIN